MPLETNFQIWGKIQIEKSKEIKPKLFKYKFELKISNS